MENFQVQRSFFSLAGRGGGHLVAGGGADGPVAGLGVGHPGLGERHVRVTHGGVGAEKPETEDGLGEDIEDGV